MSSNSPRASNPRTTTKVEAGSLEIRALTVIADEGPTTVANIAAEINKTLPATRSVLYRLRDKGLAGSMRVYGFMRWYLTPPGMREVERIDTIEVRHG